MRFHTLVLFVNSSRASQLACYAIFPSFKKLSSCFQNSHDPPTFNKHGLILTSQHHVFFYFFLLHCQQRSPFNPEYYCTIFRRSILLPRSTTTDPEFSLDLDQTFRDDNATTTRHTSSGEEDRRKKPPRARDPQRNTNMSTLFASSTGLKEVIANSLSGGGGTTADTVVATTKNQTQGVISDVKETTQDVVSNVKETTQDAVSNVKDTTQDAVSNVKEATQDAVSNVKETTQDTVSNVKKDTTQDAVSNVINQTDGFVSTAKDTTQGFVSNVVNQKEDPDPDTDTATTEEAIPVLVVVTSTVDPTTVNDDDTGTMLGGLKETLSEGVDTVVDKTQTVLGGVTDLFQDVTASVSISFDNATTVAWEPYGNSSTTEDDSDSSSAEDVFGQCGDVLFGDDAYAGPAYFPVFVNTRPILSAHDQIWRGGHTNDILQLLIGSSDEKVDYLTGVVVSAVTILVIFLAWMITLITLSCYGSHRVGFWSGRRRPLPPRLRRTTRSTTNESAAGTPVVVTDDTKGNDDGPSSADNALADEGGEGNTTNTNSSHLAGTKEDSSSSLPTQLGSSRTTGAASLTQSDRKGTIIDRLTRRFRKQHKSCDEKTTVPPGLPDKEWEALYATKKKEEMYMKGIVLFACVIVICMAGVMANKGIGRLIDSLRDGKETIGYANDLIIGGNSYVTDLASGIESFRVDVLDLLNQTNTKLCPRLKPEGLCPRLMEIDSCDFTIQVDFDRNTTNGREIDVDQNVTVDISDLTDAIKSKVGLNGTIDLTSLLFPNAPEVYKEMVELFSSNWTIVDEIYGFSDRINSISTIASRTEEQVGNLEWVFYIAVGFDVFVGILVLCMIVHILVGRNLPASVRCIQRRFLFPVFIFCVSLAFIFAIAFLVGTWVYIHFQNIIVLVKEINCFSSV